MTPHHMFTKGCRTMKHSFQGISVETPDDYGFDEAMLTLRSSAADELDEPMLTLKKKFPVRSNLIIHRRMVHEEATLEMLSGEICAELVSSVAGMENLAMERFTFADEADGMMIAFDFALAKVKAEVRQYQALRLDDQCLTSLTLTVDRNKMTKQGKADVLALLGSASPT